MEGRGLDWMHEVQADPLSSPKQIPFMAHCLLIWKQTVKNLHQWQAAALLRFPLSFPPEQIPKRYHHQAMKIDDVAV